MLCLVLHKPCHTGCLELHVDVVAPANRGSIALTQAKSKQGFRCELDDDMVPRKQCTEVPHGTSKVLTAGAAGSYMGGICH